MSPAASSPTQLRLDADRLRSLRPVSKRTTGQTHLQRIRWMLRSANSVAAGLASRPVQQPIPRNGADRSYISLRRAYRQPFLTDLKSRCAVCSPDSIAMRTNVPVYVRRHLQALFRDVYILHES